VTARYRAVPLFHKGRTEEHTRIIAQTVNGMLRGRSNNTTTVTLAANATETVIEDDRYTRDTIPLLVPQSASAAAAVGVYAVGSAGKITIGHDSSESTDRTFGVVYFG